jgi:DNA-directed RNA polymerase specialized sigma24 family protein
MFGRLNPRKQEESPYAKRSDFCGIFEKDMNRLYLLSLLLTGDRTTAEQCFVGGLHLAQEGNHVFKEWAEAWARRAIIQNAIRLSRPRVAMASATPHAINAATTTERPEIARIISLPTFERFAFVMSVLEGYGDQESSLLLGCRRADVAEARTRALVQVGKSAELSSKLVKAGAVQRSRRDDSGTEFGPAAALSLATPA